jgi:hypothetical protein
MNAIIQSVLQAKSRFGSGLIADFAPKVCQNVAARRHVFPVGHGWGRLSERRPAVVSAASALKSSKAVGQHVCSRLLAAYFRRSSRSRHDRVSNCVVAIDLAELRQRGEQRIGEGRADARHAGLRFAAAGLERRHWSNAGPIRTIFKEAFASAGLPYFNPHSFRKTLALLGQTLCRTPEEYKAWSQNLGHEHILTTFCNYGDVSSHRQMEILRSFP